MQYTRWTYNHRALVVLLVLVKDEDIYTERSHGVQEGEHTNRHKELS